MARFYQIILFMIFWKRMINTEMRDGFDGASVEGKGFQRLF